MPRLSEINQKPEAYMAALKQFLNNPYGFYLIAGTNGNGKTFTAKALYECFRCHDPDEKMFTTQTDLNLLWQKDLYEWGSTLYLLDKIVKTKLLILDDLGTRTPTDAFMDFLYAIADKRYNDRDKCGTVITTNLNASMLRERFGDAFTSRVASGIIVRHDGEDRRINKF